MAVRRVERLINLVAALLDTRRPLSAEEIRTRIAGYDQDTHDAFRRAFERDKETLRAMGVPIEVHPVPGEDVDGYIIPKEKYYLPELDLEPDEVAALRLAASVILGSGAVAESGLMKLSIDAGRAGERMEWTGPRVVWGADVATEQPLLGDLYAALLERSPVTFEYRTADGVSSLRTVESYGLVHRAGHWYLVGRDEERDAVRSFKVTRITGKIQTVPDGYSIPDDFDAAAHLGREPWEIGDDAVDVTVRFDPEIAWWADQNLTESRVDAAADGGRTVTMTVANVDALISWVVGFGEGIEIVAPEDIRLRLLDHLRPFLARA